MESSTHLWVSILHILMIAPGNKRRRSDSECVESRRSRPAVVAMVDNQPYTHRAQLCFRLRRLFQCHLPTSVFTQGWVWKVRMTALVPVSTSPTSSSCTLLPTDPVHRYHFGLLGHVKEILYPNKAVIQFKINDRDERAILLSKMFHLNGKPLDEAQATKQPISDFIKVGELLNFDCHIYDKGGDVGGGKDRCNYFVMKAQKELYLKDFNSKITAAGSSSSGGLRTNCHGWVSEINSQNGVLTYSSNGVDQRVSFHGNRVFLYEKRLGIRHNLETLLQLGEKVQFDAVPSDTGVGVDFCPMMALMVWKGKRPAIDSTVLTDQQQVLNSIDCGGLFESRTTSRKGSVDSSSSSSAGVDDNSLNHSSNGSFLIIPSYLSSKQSEVFRGIGMIAKLIDDTSGVIWWVRKPNHYSSVWFHAHKTFKFGYNLYNKSLPDYVKEGNFLRGFYMQSSIWNYLFFQAMLWWL